MGALLVREARVVREVFEADGLLLRQRILLADEDVRLRAVERREAQAVVEDGAPHDRLVGRIEVEHADLAAQAADIFENLVGLCLAHVEFVLLSPVLAQQVDEGLDGKRIVLRRNAEELLLRPLLAIALPDHRLLLEHLARIGEEFLALDRQRDALVRAPEDRDAELFLQCVDGGRQARLRDEEPLRRLCDGT